jgi:hypothetical protein
MSEYAHKIKISVVHTDVQGYSVLFCTIPYMVNLSIPD